MTKHKKQATKGLGQQAGNKWGVNLRNLVYCIAAALLLLLATNAQASSFPMNGGTANSFKGTYTITWSNFYQADQHLYWNG